MARILVVDDFPPALVLLEAQLSSGGHQVVTCPNATDALATADRGGFDLFVLDVLMPGVDGIETCRRLRSRGRREPVLFLTAVTDANTRIRAFEAGGNAFVRKPVERLDLLGAVTRLLEAPAP